MPGSSPRRLGWRTVFLVLTLAAVAGSAAGVLLAQAVAMVR